MNSGLYLRSAHIAAVIIISALHIFAAQATPNEAGSITQSNRETVNRINLILLPEYPQAALSAGIEGIVKVEISISEKGAVTSARAISGPDILKGAAEEAARACQFNHVTKPKPPASVVSAITFQFLKDRKAPAIDLQDSDLVFVVPGQWTKGPIRVRRLSPKAIHRTNPEYPSIAKMRRVQGSVEVALLIDETGSVISAQPLSGSEALHEAAIKAARQWKFETLKISGTPVMVLATITFNWSLG